jgi:hypothetical protein
MDDCSVDHACVGLDGQDVSLNAIVVVLSSSSYVSLFMACKNLIFWNLSFVLLKE